MIIIKFIIGGTIIVLLDFISKSSKYYYLSGLLPLFPTFALIAHFLVYKYNGSEALKETALFGLFSLVPYSGYLISVYFLSKINFLFNILISLSIWFIISCIIIYFK